MTTDSSSSQHERGWEHFGRAAEHFAHRVARDARVFAARIEEHVSELAQDVRREWRCGPFGDRRHRHRSGSPEDVRRVFEDIRGVLSGILDGVDEFVTRAFQDASASAPGGAPAGAHAEPDEPWARVVCNREARCGTCERTIGAGEEAHHRRTTSGREFRCLECGVSGEPPPSA